MVMYGCIWSCMVVYGRVWLYMVVYGHVWLYMVMYCYGMNSSVGCMVLYGHGKSSGGNRE